MSKRIPIPKIEQLSKESQYLYDVFNLEENDRALVLIAASYLDNALASMLKLHFIQENDVVNRLFDPLQNGPLSEFGVRIDIAYCLGLISEAFQKNLKTIARIRNKFAHTYSPLDLNDPEIAQQVASLTSLLFGKMDVDRDGVKNAQGPLPWADMSARERFGVVVIEMFNRLLLHGLSMKRTDEKTKT